MGIGTDETLAESSEGGGASGASESPSRASLSLPEIPRSAYIVRGELARGGMGKILVAEDTRLGRDVALKELLVSDAGLVERFAREVRTTARLQHPGIVAVYEAGRWPDGEPFYAMRLVKGRSLEKVVDTRPELAERLRLVPNLVNLTEAMAYAHDRGVIHRDLKPANVLVGDYGETVVIDWGLAKVIGEDDELRGDDTEIAAADGLTQYGAVVGTPAYMPPEQARGEPVDKRADVYALGALIYHVLAGKPPYAGTSVEEVLDHVKSPGALAPLAKVVPDAPPELVTIVERAMAHDPDLRYPSAHELAEELASFQAGRLVASHRYTTWQLARRWVRRYRALVLAALALIVGAGVVAAVTVQQVIAERDRARLANLAALEEQGRREVLADHPRRAAAYLVEAYRGGRDGEAVRALLGEAMRAVDANVASTQLDSPIAHLVWVRGDRAVVAITEAGQVFAIDASTGAREVIAPPKDGLPIHPSHVAVSADGTWLAMHDARVLRVHDLVHHKGLDIPIWRRGEPAAMSVSPRGELVTVVSDGHAFFYRTSDGQEARLRPNDIEGAVAIAEDRIEVVEHQRVRVFDRDPTHEPTDARELPEPVRAVVPCRSGLAITTTTADPAPASHVVVVTPAGVATAELDATVVACGSAALLATPGRAPLAVLAADGTRAELGVAGERAHATDGDDDTSAAATDVRYRVFAIDGRSELVAAGTARGDITVWDVTSQLAIARFDGHARGVRALAFTADGAQLASAGDDGAVRVWSTAGWRGGVATAAPDATSADGTTRVTAALAEVTLVTPAGTTALARHEEVVTWVGVDPSGAFVAAAARDGRVVEWDARSHAIVGEWRQTAAISDGAVARDGTLATGTLDGVVAVWRPGTREPRATLAGHATAVHAVAWDPTGATLLTAADTVARLWTPDGELVRQLEAGEAIDRAWWLDARFVVLATARGTQIWDATSGLAIARVADRERGVDAPSVTVSGAGAATRPEPHATPATAARTIVRRGARELAWSLARETRDGEVVAARVAASLPWRLDGSVLVPKTAPVVVRTDEAIAAETRSRVFDFAPVRLEAAPSRPAVPLVAAAAGDPTAAAILEAAAALQLGKRAAAARARLAGSAVPTDPALRYALAWDRHWLRDDLAAFDAIAGALAAWPAADPRRDDVRRDARDFAAWAGVAPGRALATLGDTPTERLALADAYVDRGRLDLAETALAFADGGDPGLVRELALVRIATLHGEPIEAATHAIAAIAIGKGRGNEVVAPFASACTSAPATHDEPAWTLGVGGQVRELIGAFATVYAAALDYRYAIAARRLLDELAASYHFDDAGCRAHFAELARRDRSTPTFAKRLIAQVVSARSPMISSCFTRALDDDPAFHGFLAAHFTLSIRGRVEAVDIDLESTDHDATAAFASCARNVFSQLVFPNQSLIAGRTLVIYGYDLIQAH